jgi:hypothetical protein
MTATLNAHGHGLLAQIGDVVHDLPAFLTAPLYLRWHLAPGPSTSRESKRVAAEGDVCASCTSTS